MPAGPPTEHESRRVAATRRVRLLGTPAEERFDKLTRRAMTELGAAASALEIVGEQLAWRKSAHGFDALDVLRSGSFADYVIEHAPGGAFAEAIVDIDATTGAVAEAYPFRAGIAVSFEGEPVAVLSVADRHPRTVTGSEVGRLRELAFAVEGELPIVALSEMQIHLAASGSEDAMRGRIDRLTRFWNRDALAELAARELARVESSGTMTGFVLLEVDGDRADGPRGEATASVAVSDSMIRTVAARLRACTRPMDALGRYGHSSFGLVLQNATVEGTARAAERLRVAVSADALSSFGPPLGRLTCNTGFSVVTDGGDAVHELLQSAEEALQRAKTAPRDRSRPQGLGKLTRVG